MTKKIHWAWVILAVSCCTLFTTYSIRLGYGILMPEMITSLRISNAQAGAIASCFYLSYTVVTPLVGFLTDRFSVRKLLVIFCLIQGVGVFLMGKATSFHQVCLFYAIVGVGASAMWAPVATLVQRWFGLQRRSLALGILSISYSIGYGVMGLVFPLLVSRFDWQACWFLLSGLSCALVPLMGFFLRNYPRDMNLHPWGDKMDLFPKGYSEEVTPKTSYIQLIKVGNLWWVGFSYFFIAFMAYSVNFLIVAYGMMELHYPFGQAAKLASAIAFCGILGAFCLPILVNSLGSKKSLILINALMAVSILLIIGVGDRWLPLLAGVSLFGVFFAMAWPMYAMAAADFSPSGATGSVLGFWTIFYGCGIMLAPYLGGLVADLTGSFRWSLLIGAGAGFPSILCLSMAIKTPGLPK